MIVFSSPKGSPFSVMRTSLSASGSTTIPTSALFSCPITGKRNRNDIGENTENERLINKNGNKRRVSTILENKTEKKIIEKFSTLDDVAIYNVYDKNENEYDIAGNSAYQSANNHRDKHSNTANSERELNEIGKFKILYRSTNTDLISGSKFNERTFIC